MAAADHFVAAGLPRRGQAVLMNVRPESDNLWRRGARALQRIHQRLDFKTRQRKIDYDDAHKFFAASGNRLLGVRYGAQPGREICHRSLYSGRSHKIAAEKHKIHPRARPLDRPFAAV
ncbi:MAG TPA: hypothetical protein VGK58_15700, partial [Lacipirellulaceae bacterium]